MALFRRTPKVEAPAVAEDEKRSLGGLYAPTSLDFFLGNSASGAAVTIDTALENIAVWACQRVLVSTISMFPVNVFRGGNLPVAPPPMVRNPSGRVSQRAWVAQILRSMLGAGNIYGRVVATDSLARPTQIESISPNDVAWRIVAGEEVATVNGKAQTLWPLGDFWHVPASQFVIPGSRVAMSPTEFAKTAIGTGLAAERFGANFFRDGLSPTAVAKVKTKIDQTQALAIKQAVMNMHRGNREPAVIGDDIDLQPWSAKLTDSQFIELLQFEVLQACRVYGVPPSMVYAAVTGQNVTYANIGQADMQYLKFGVTPWIIDIEDAWSDLIAVPHSVRFDTSGLLRMDDRERADLADVRLKSRTTTINEVRKSNGEEPFADPIYDEPGVPGGQETFSQLARGLTPAVGVWMTDNEARAIATAAGAELDPVADGTFDKPVQQQLPLDTGGDSGRAATHLHLGDRGFSPEQVETLVRSAMEQRMTSEELLAALREMPAPVVNVESPTVVNQIPAQIAPVVNVSAPPASVTVPAPVVNVQPEIVLAEKPTRKVVKYDTNGRVAEIIEKEA